MTPKEILLAYNGYRRRMDEQWELSRWHACHVMTMLGGKDFNPELVRTPMEVMKLKKTKPDPKYMLVVNKKDA